MPIARVQLPNGRIARFDVPEGTTPQQVQQIANRQLQQQETLEQRAIRLGAVPGIGLTERQISQINRNTPITLTESQKQQVADIDRLKQEGFVSTESIEPVGTLGAIGLGAARGLERIGAGALRLGSEIAGEQEFAEDIARKSRGLEEQFRAQTSQAPVSSFVGEVVGETAAAPFGGFGPSIARRVTTSIPVAGGVGAVSEAGRGSGAEDILESAAISSAFAPAAEFIGKNISMVKRLLGPRRERISDKRVEIRSSELESRGLSPEAATRVAQAEEFGTSLTRGQATRDFGIFEKEETLRSLSTPEGAEARQIFAEQQRSLINAKNDLADSIAADALITRRSVGEQLKNSVRDLNKVARREVANLYERIARTEGGDIQLKTDTLRDAADRAIGEFVPEQRIERGIERILNDFSQTNTAGSKTFKGPLTFANAEDFRKRLNKLNPSNPADIAVVSEMKSAIDDLLVASAREFPEGSEVAAAAINARTAALDRFRDFDAKDIIDDLQATKGRTLTDKFTDEEVLDKVIKSPKRVENVRRIKSLLTGKRASVPSRQAFKNLQAQAIIDVFGRAITETPDGFTISGQKLNSEVARVGQDTLKELLDEAQLSQFNKLRRVVGDATIPVPRTTNPSGTAAKILNTLGNIGFLSRGGLTDKVISISSGLITGAEDLANRRAILDGMKSVNNRAQNAQSLLDIISAASARSAQRVGQDRADSAEDEVVRPN